MLKQFGCAKGHRWESNPKAIDPNLLALACPECGGTAETWPPAGTVGPDCDDLPVIAGYEIRGGLGAGGMGVVYKARHLALDRDVALKLMRPTASENEVEQLRRFRLEATTAAQLRHPGIVEVYEVGAHAGRPYFSMELVEGGSLDARLKAGPLAPPQAAGLVEKVARAVHVAHEAKVIHRDLKPANVLLTTDGTPKVADFGLAKRLDDTGHTQSGALVGTPSYLAPEQARGDKDVGPLADVYALGAILYECLTGRPPFKAASVHETLLQVIAEEPVSPRRLQSTTPRDLETICLKCLHKEPAKRYESAWEMAEDLKRYLEERPIRARPVGALERGRRWATRNPLVAGLAAAVVVSLLLGVFFFGWKAREARASAAQARESAAQAGRAEGEAVRQAAVATLERAQAFCEQGDVARGLLLMTHGLALAEKSGDRELTDVIRWNVGAWRAECHTLDRVLLHPGEVAAAAFSPDGRWIATGCSDGRLRIWRLDAGPADEEGKEPEFELPGHKGGVLGLAFHPSGRLLVSSGRDSVLRAWDLDRRKLVWQEPIVSKDLTSLYQTAPVAFSPDGTRVAVGSRAGVSVFVAESGTPLDSAETILAEGLTFLPDGRLLTVDEKLFARTWCVGMFRPDAEPWRTAPESRTRGHDSRATAASPDGKYLVTSQLEDRATRVWDLQTKTLVRELPIGAVATHFSPDGRWLLTGTWEGAAQVWDLENGVAAFGQPLQHTRRVLAVQFHPDSRRLLTSGGDNVLRVWRLAAGRLVRKCKHEDNVLTAAFSPDSSRLATGTGWREPQLCLWDVATGRQLIDATLPPARSVADVVFHPDGKSAFVAINGKGDGKGGDTGFAVYRWAFEKTGPGTRLCKHDREIWRLAASPDGKFVAAGGSDHFLGAQGRQSLSRLWSDTGDPVGCSLKHDGRVTGLAFSRDGETLLTGGFDGKVYFWDTKTGKKRIGQIDRAAEIRAVATSPDGNEFATGGNDHFIQRWDWAERRPLGPVMDQKSVIFNLAYNHDGRALLCGSGNGSARLWHVASGHPVGPAMRHDSEVRAVACSPDGRWLATGGQEGSVGVWSIPIRADDSWATMLRDLKLQTGMTLDDDHNLRVLAGAAWLELREKP